MSKKTKNPNMVKAGKKAAATKKINKETEHQKWVNAGVKAWETRRANQLKLSIKKADKLVKGQGKNITQAAKGLKKLKKLVNVSVKTKPSENLTTLIGLSVLTALDKKGFKIVKK